jgi:hypothetical protein
MKEQKVLCGDCDHLIVTWNEERLSDPAFRAAVYLAAFNHNRKTGHIKIRIVNAKTGKEEAPLREFGKPRNAEE